MLSFSLVWAVVCWLPYLRSVCCVSSLPYTGAGGGSSSEDDDAEEGWGSAGDVMLGVPVATMETLYQQYLAEPDFLDKVRTK